MKQNYLVFPRRDFQIPKLDLRDHQHQKGPVSFHPFHHFPISAKIYDYNIKSTFNLQNCDIIIIIL